MQGYGILYFSDGSIFYDGFWKNDKRDGSGYEINLNGNTYKGEWRMDEYHGKGSFKSPNYQYDGKLFFINDNNNKKR